MNLSDYCSQNPDSPVAWNYRHISRYPNLRAAEQWLQAMVNAEIENKRFHHFIDLYEKTGIDKHLLTASASNKACAEWEKGCTFLPPVVVHKGRCDRCSDRIRRRDCGSAKACCINSRTMTMSFRSRKDVTKHRDTNNLLLRLNFQSQKEKRKMTLKLLPNQCCTECSD